MVDTLEYLEKGGRIGKAQALMGGLLNIKPILTITNGEINPVDKVRGKTKAINKIMGLLKESYEGERVSVSLMYSTSRDDVDLLKTNLTTEFNCEEIIEGRFGPVIGTHVGPGAIGVCMDLK